MAAIIASKARQGVSAAPSPPSISSSAPSSSSASSSSSSSAAVAVLSSSATPLLFSPASPSSATTPASAFAAVAAAAPSATPNPTFLSLLDVGAGGDLGMSSNTCGSASRGFDVPASEEDALFQAASASEGLLSALADGDGMLACNVPSAPTAPSSSSGLLDPLSLMMTLGMGAVGSMGMGMCMGLGLGLSSNPALLASQLSALSALSALASPQPFVPPSSCAVSSCSSALSAAASSAATPTPTVPQVPVFFPPSAPMPSPQPLAQPRQQLSSSLEDLLRLVRSGHVADNNHGSSSGSTSTYAGGSFSFPSSSSSSLASGAGSAALTSQSMCSSISTASSHSPGPYAGESDIQDIDFELQSLPEDSDECGPHSDHEEVHDGVKLMPIISCSTAAHLSSRECPSKKCPRKEPLASQYRSHEEYEDAYARWRSSRCRNNESVKRCREKARYQTKANKALLKTQEQHHRELLVEASQLRSHVSVLLKALRNPLHLTQMEQIMVTAILSKESHTQNHQV